MKLKWIFCFLIYLSVIILMTPTVVAWQYRLSFWLFAIFLFWIAPFVYKGNGEISQREWQLSSWFIIGLLFLARLAPFVHFGEAPLGYDTGIYLRAFERYLSDPAEAVRPLGLVVNILSSIGLSTNAILHGFLVVLNIALGISLYTVARAIFRDKLIALCVFFIFALSISQYEAYIWMFYRMMISMMLFMITFSLFARRSYLAIITGGFAGALHPATFLIFGISYAAYCVIAVVQKIMGRFSRADLFYTISVGLAVLFLAIILNTAEFSFERFYLTQYKLQIPNFSPYISSEITGFYIGLTNFLVSALFYIPFAFLGLGWVFSQPRAWWRGQEKGGLILLLIFAVLTFVFVAAHLIFYQRYLIILDLSIVIFAGVFLSRFIQYFKDIKQGRILLLVFIAGFSIIILYYSWNRGTWIPPDELREIKNVAVQIGAGDYAMATDAYYMPWVYGYMTDRTIAPGYFADKWSIGEWQQFWRGGTDKERKELLERYGASSIYIFIGSKQPENKPMRTFVSKNSIQLSEHIWKYQDEK